MAESATAQRTPGAKAKAGKGRRVFRVCWRVVRVTLVIALVVIVACLVYLAQIGLPPGMQEQLTARLRQQGWEVQFSNMRLSFSRMGIVAENLYLRRTVGPQIYVARAQCRMRPGALRRLKLELASVKLAGARVIWPMEKTHEPGSTFLLNNIRGELHFRDHDIWDLQGLNATMMGARVNLSGTLTNGSLLRDWRVPQLRAGVRTENLARWRALLNTAQQIHFQGAPEVVARFDADAAQLEGGRANLVIHVPGVTSPWGGGSNLLVTARLNSDPDETQHPLEVDVLFEHGSAPWARAASFSFKTRVGMDFAHAISPTNLNALIEAKSIEGPWGAVERVSGEVRFSGSTTEGQGLETAFDLKTTGFRHERFEAAAAEIRAAAWHRRTNWFVAALRDLAATNRPLSQRFEQIPIEADFSIAAGKAGAVDTEELLVRTQWHWPIATLAVEGKVEDGGLRAGGTLNTTNGHAQFTASSDVDPHRVSPILPERARNWLTNYQWQAAPKLEARGRVIIPAATNRVDWLRDLQPTLFAEGAFGLGPCRYRGVPVDGATSGFWFSNSVFCMPDLQLRRPEGIARGTYTSVPATRDFHWQISSQIDPRVLRPLFPGSVERQAFAMVELSSPPRIYGQLWGRWGDPTRLGVIASVEATNFAVRGQPAQLVRAGVTFTNMQLELIEPEVIRPNERGTAARIAIDIKEQRMYFTNVESSLDPQAVARAIGSSASNAIAPYVFAVPPAIKLNGVLDIKRGRREDDMHFTVAGGPFYWAPFHAHRIGGQVHWAGQNLLLNNVIAQLHGGQASGDAKFEISTNGEAHFQFRTEWSDIDLKSLARDFSTRTNALEGILRGNLQIVNANTRQPKSWNGRGMVELKDGLLWDFPMFGVFSPVLNAFAPGVGNSRARDGAASFIITNSVIHTTDLEINATAMRMQFSGTIDFERRIDGRMEAELLRNVPAIGFLLSKILWPVTKIFEYKITGPLEQPKTEPVYILPKVILFPFSPIKTMKDLLGIEPGEVKTQ